MDSRTFLCLSRARSLSICAGAAHHHESLFLSFAVGKIVVGGQNIRETERREHGVDTKEGCVDKLSLALVVLKGTPFLLCFFGYFFVLLLHLSSRSRGRRCRRR